MTPEQTDDAEYAQYEKYTADRQPNDPFFTFSGWLRAGKPNPGHGRDNWQTKTSAVAGDTLLYGPTYRQRGIRK